jgi:hypothetical protein
MFWKLLLTTTVALALSVPAIAANAPPAHQNPAMSNMLGPALVTSSITLNRDKGPFTVDNCRNYAFNVMSKMKVERARQRQHGLWRPAGQRPQIFDRRQVRDRKFANLHSRSRSRSERRRSSYEAVGGDVVRKLTSCSKNCY